MVNVNLVLWACMVMMELVLCALASVLDVLVRLIVSLVKMDFF